MAARLFTGALVIPIVWAKINVLDFDPSDVINKDVAIIGGGAAGSHAAVRLRENYGKGVVVVERETTLGGHVNTYIDRETGQVHDYGVAVYFPYEDAMDFFTQVNVTTYLNPGFGNNREVYADFTTGQTVANYAGADAGRGFAAMKKYHDLTTEKGYDKITQPGYFNLPPGKDIPEDLLLPLGGFVKKYAIEDLLPLMYPTTAGGIGSRGNFTQLLTLTFMKAFPTAWYKAYLGEVPMYRVEGGNQNLYTKIAAILGTDVLYESRLVETHRTDTGVELVIQDKTGGKKLIKAKKLLMAIPPSRENIAPLDLSTSESAHFNKTKYGRSHTGIVRHSRLPRNVTLRNTPLSAAENPLSPFLKTPFVMSFSHYGGASDLFSLGVSGNDYYAFDVEAAQKTAQRNLEALADVGTIPPLGGEVLGFVAWSDHGVGGFGVSAEDMRAGWMDGMNRLQGARSTWYTGSGIAADFTTMLWKFNDEVLKRMVKTM
ncbi:hypothetical protein OQA88_11479 [Cercophora sp. LCS_1]